jgi:hypothetical protein
LKQVTEKTFWLESEIGNISPDQVAVLGLDGQIHLFDGSNKHYLQYLNPAGNQIGSIFCDSVSQLSNLLESTGTKFQVHISPNKSTCLNSTFGLYTPSETTIALRGIIEKDISFVTISFLDKRNTFESDPSSWWKTDSHSNSFGARSAADQILKKWNIEMFPAGTEDYINEYTDLSRRWPGIRYLEPKNRRFVRQNSSFNHEVVFDNFDSNLSKLRGRCSISSGTIASEKSLLVVGQSTMGHGLVSENISYWIRPHFRTSLVLTEDKLPSLDFLKQFTHVLFSIEERFICGGIGFDTLNSILSSHGGSDDFDSKFKEYFR